MSQRVSSRFHHLPSSRSLRLSMTATSGSISTRRSSYRSRRCLVRYLEGSRDVVKQRAVLIPMLERHVNDQCVYVALVKNLVGRLAVRPDGVSDTVVNVYPTLSDSCISVISETRTTLGSARTWSRRRSNMVSATSRGHSTGTFNTYSQALVARVGVARRNPLQIRICVRDVLDVGHPQGWQSEGEPARPVLLASEIYERVGETERWTRPVLRPRRGLRGRGFLHRRLTLCEDKGPERYDQERTKTEETEDDVSSTSSPCVSGAFGWRRRRHCRACLGSGSQPLANVRTSRCIGSLHAASPPQSASSVHGLPP